MKMEKVVLQNKIPKLDVQKRALELYEYEMSQKHGIGVSSLVAAELTEMNVPVHFVSLPLMENAQMQKEN